MRLDPLLDYEDEAAGLFRWCFKRESVNIDNIVFFMHYNVTVSLLIAASLLVTAGLYIADPIECISDSSIKDVIDSFCWVHSTFTVPGQWNASILNVAHPGVTTADMSDPTLKFHGYYQWVCYVLGIQALIFYIPRCLWKSWEGGKIKELVQELNIAVKNLEECSDKKSRILQHFVENLGQQNFYFRKLVFCEFLNLSLTLAQFWITNAFLGYEITKFSFMEIIRLLTVNNPLEREDYIAQTFPKVTKCIFNTYGPSGSIQNNDALCVLPFNVINEKIYLTLWLWLMVLACMSSLVLIYRAVLVLIPSIRMSILKQSTRHQEIDSFKTLREKLKIGDWLILNQLSANMDTIRFTDMVKDLQRELEGKSV